MKKALLSFAVIVALLCLWKWPQIVKTLTYNPIVWPAWNVSPATTAEANAQDLQFLRGLTRYDRSFTAETAQQFHRYLNSLEATVGSLNKNRLYHAAARATALADNAHTNIDLTPVLRDANYVGVRFYWFADRLYIVRVDRENQHLLGAEVVAIEGRPVTNVASMMEQYFGGLPQWRRLRATALLESPAILHGAEIAASPDQMRLDLQLPDGKAVSVNLPALAAPRPDIRIDARPIRLPWHSLLPHAFGTEGEDWLGPLSGVSEPSLPVSLRNPLNSVTAVKLPNCVYLRINQVLDNPEQTLASALEQALADYASGSLDKLIIDWRWNAGGDFTKFAPAIGAVLRPLRADGKLYQLVGPQTFSAAIVSVAMLKVHAAPRAVMVGEPMGDSGVFWAERGLPFRLPNAGYSINYATGYHDWVQGCEGQKYCFPEAVKLGVKAGSLEPDVSIVTRYEDFAAGRDRLLDWALADTVKEAH